MRVWGRFSAVLRGPARTQQNRPADFGHEQLRVVKASSAEILAAIIAARSESFLIVDIRRARD
jgi:hypothetical protein